MACHVPSFRSVLLWLARSVLPGLIWVSLLVFKCYFDDTAPGKLLERAVYALLQTRLTRDGSLPVAVVDISRLDARQIEGHPSPREQLRRVIDAVVAKQPVAIGIDIDFSPEGNGWTERGGPQLFDYIQRLKIPVFLGVSRSRYDAPESWLGANEYKDLAVTISVPRDDNRTLPLWIGNEECSATVAGLLGRKDLIPPAASAACLPSMSTALAQRYRGNKDRESCGWEWFARSSSIKPLDQKKAEYFWVDYGAAQSVQDQLSQATALGEHASLNINHALMGFQKRIVILGNTQWEVTPDKYPIPPWEAETPGVFFHASGVYTLIKGPLREITCEGRLLLDPGIGLVVGCLGLLGACLLHGRRLKEKSAVQKHSMRWWKNWAMIFLFAGLGVGFVRATRILWTDWLWACVAVLIQGWLEEHLEPYVERKRQRNPKVWCRFIFVLIDGGKE
jgi:hypothetical protein